MALEAIHQERIEYVPSQEKDSDRPTTIVIKPIERLDFFRLASKYGDLLSNPEELKEPESGNVRLDTKETFDFICDVIKLSVKEIQNVYVGTEFYSKITDPNTIFQVIFNFKDISITNEVIDEILKTSFSNEEETQNFFDTSNSTS